MTPLAVSLATVASREPWLEVRAGRPADTGWHLAADLLAPAALADLVRTGVERLAVEHPAAAAQVLLPVAAAVLLDHWAWALAVVGAGALAATGDVVDLAPERVHLRLDGGEVTGVAVTALSPAQGEAGLRAELTGHLARLHALLTAGPAPLLRRGRRLLQGGTGDAVVSALSRQADGLDDDARARLRALSDRLLAGAGTWGEPGWLVVDGGGPHERRTRRRTACCLWYRLPEQSPCLTCPRLSDADRATRLRAQVRTEVPA